MALFNAQNSVRYASKHNLSKSYPIVRCSSSLFLWCVGQPLNDILSSRHAHNRDTGNLPYY